MGSLQVLPESIDCRVASQGRRRHRRRRRVLLLASPPRLPKGLFLPSPRLFAPLPKATLDLLNTDDLRCYPFTSPHLSLHSPAAFLLPLFSLLLQSFCLPIILPFSSSFLSLGSPSLSLSCPSLSLHSPSAPLPSPFTLSLSSSFSLLFLRAFSLPIPIFLSFNSLSLLLSLPLFLHSFSLSFSLAFCLSTSSLLSFHSPFRPPLHLFLTLSLSFALT